MPDDDSTPPVTRGQFLKGLLASSVLPAASAELLNLRRRGDHLFVSAPRLELLRGPLMDRLRNGSTVPFDFHLALWTGMRSQLRRRAFERFVVSYDLWEERFSVTGLRSPRPSASNLSASAVPAWCLDHISLHPVELPGDTPVWVRLDVRAVEAREARLVDEDGLSLTSLIDLLSRPSRREPNRWTLETGPVSFSTIPT
jgi:hypothetical protein